MKRKTTDTPTRIYAYRCLAPITEVDRVEDQFRLGSQYRNALVEVEHRVRDQFRSIQLADPIVGAALRHYQDAEGAVDNAYEDLRAAKSGVADPDLTEHRERLDAEKELRKLASEALRDAKTARADVLKPLYEEARAWGKTESKARRHVFTGRGLRHGAYARIDDAVRQATSSTKRPLMFKRYDGAGTIGTQLTETGSGVRSQVHSGEESSIAIGMTWRELISGLDPRLRLGPPGALDKHPRAEVTACKTWDEAMRLGCNLRRHAARTYIDLRVASNPDRSPIFARFPVTLHRLPPKDTVIKWAHVIRRRLGFHFEWQFQLSLESKTFERPPIAIGEGVCAVNLGWRRLFDEAGDMIGLRAGFVVDEAGNEKEILVPGHRGRSALSAIGKNDDLAAIRSKALEHAQASLAAWVTEHGVPASWTTAEPLRTDGVAAKTVAERFHGYSAWRAPWKLRNFIDLWTKRRAAGDDLIYTAMVAWAKQDRHLEAWQAHQRDKTTGRRREAWRLAATALARTYSVILIGEMKLPSIDGWEQPAAEDGDPHEGREQRRMSRIAAPGELREEIEKAAAKTGARVIRCKEKHATQICSYCDHAAPWDAKPSVRHTCEGCGRTWDQDANYGKNLLRWNTPASGSMSSPSAEPLAPAMHAKRVERLRELPATTMAATAL
jgi:hypothetical protein